MEILSEYGTFTLLEHEGQTLKIKCRMNRGAKVFAEIGEHFKPEIGDINPQEEKVFEVPDGTTKIHFFWLYGGEPDFTDPYGETCEAWDVITL